MGIGDWGLGIGDWAQSPIPNPQSPIPNPQKNKKNNFYFAYNLLMCFKLLILFIKENNNKLIKNRYFTL